MNLHAGIASRPSYSFKGPPKLHIGYFVATLHVGIAFKVKVSYNFAIFTHILTLTNYKFSLNFIKY